MRLKYSISFFLFFSIILLPMGECQEDARRYEILRGIHDYREYVLTEYDTLSLYMGKIIDKLMERGYSGSEISRMSSMINRYAESIERGKASDNIYYDVYPFLPGMLDALTDREIEFLLDNEFFLYFLTAGYFHYSYPFLINSKDKIYNEISFYNISAGDSIADIGAGTGVFGFGLVVIYDSIKLYQNELSKRQLNAIGTLNDFLHPLLEDDEVILIQGHASHTGLEASTVNIITLRQVLHHVTHPSTFLEFVFETLCPGGTMYIKEFNTPDACINYLSPKTIQKMASGAGFTYKETLTLDHETVYKFQKPGNSN